MGSHWHQGRENPIIGDRIPGHVTIASVQEMERARDGVAILLNNVWNSVVINQKCVSSRILLTKLKFSRVKVGVVVGYSPNE